MSSTKTIYYYKGVSERYRFVTFEGKSGDPFTNEKMPVSKNCLKGRLYRFSTLKGKTVQYGEFRGKVISCNPTDKLLSGKYVGDGKYLQCPELLNINHLVLVHWKNGVLPGWFPFFKLKVL